MVFITGVYDPDTLEISDGNVFWSMSLAKFSVKRWA